MDQNKKEARDISSAIFLIFIGMIFLLNTTGIVGWEIWLYMFRFWPVFLILAGLRLIFNKSIITEILIIVLSVILFVFLGVFSYVSETSKPLRFIPTRINDYILENDDWLSIKRGPDVDEDSSVLLADYEEVDKRTLAINIGAYEFNLDDDTNLEDYLSINSKYTKNFIEPSLESNMSTEKVLAITFETLSPAEIRFWNDTKTEFNLTLGKTDLETDINIDLGAGKGTVDLKSLNAKTISSKIGAGRMEIILNEGSIPSELTLDIGTGSMTLDIPESVGYKLSYDLGVGEITENGNKITEFLGSGDSYESSNYGEAEKKLEIVAKVGVGSLEINNI